MIIIVDCAINKMASTSNLRMYRASPHVLALSLAYLKGDSSNEAEDFIVHTSQILAAVS